MKLRYDRAIAAMGAKVMHATALPEYLDIVTDTRALQPGQTFLALRGEQFDGHAFLTQAFAAGAAAVIVDEAQRMPSSRACIVVADTLQAYLALGGLSRAQYSSPLIAITGSNGKTTTKEFLAHLLARAFGDRLLASKANENNEIGVSKLLIMIDDTRHDAVVVEMGARHPGDIARLVAVARPTIGILTNIGEAHLEIFGSRDELSATKWGLFSTGAQAILNADDGESRARAGTLAKAPLWFAALDTLDDLRVDGDCTVMLGSDQLAIRTAGEWEFHQIATPLSGRHQLSNLAAAIVAARCIGISLDRIIAACVDVQLPAGRYQTLSIASLPRIIYDAYNANPSSVRAALDTFAHETGRARIAVLASMAELGPESPRMHEEIGAYAAPRVDMLLAGGEFADDLARGAQNAGLSSEKIATFSSNDEAVALLRARANHDDVLLLKGSRRYKLEEIIERLGS